MKIVYSTPSDRDFTILIPLRYTLINTQRLRLTISVEVKNNIIVVNVRIAVQHSQAFDKWNSVIEKQYHEK